MDRLFDNPNMLGYVLLAALAAVIILRLQASRRREGGRRAERRPVHLRLAELRARQGGAEAGSEAAPRELKTPGKPMSLGQARLQFYVMILAALALVLGYLVHHYR